MNMERLQNSDGDIDSYSELFILPNLELERGEIERVAVEFGAENKDKFVESFLKRAQLSKLVKLDEQNWSLLENTDSMDVGKDEWDKVAHHSVDGHSEKPRDWGTIKQKLESKEILDAPIILKLRGRLHLVSGNTRLMVSRAKGIYPKVLLIDMDELE